jgi:hypothetical protein
MTGLMYGLVMFNKIWLEHYPRTPRLYDSGALYKAERDTEEWCDIPRIITKGHGDCEDLACWRCAELQVQGILAMPYVTWRKSKGRTIYHALVRWPDGKIEDPSRALGMANHPIVKKPVFIMRDRP